jgi:2-polyprenyl-3-methyl-5-hydroxy-6-metoxy-1,4-benzoquinol methylase
MLKYHDFRAPKKLRLFYKEFSDKRFALLDVGCGNHSASVIKKRFPNVDYYGLDRASYNNSAEDFALMKKYYQIDLINDDLSKIEDNFFDVILLSHVIEHLPNGLSVLAKLSKKLNKHGKIYIEFPDVKSLSLPSACHGVLNFCDDSSHIKLYDIKEIANTLLENGIKIVRAGTVRDWIKLFFLFPLSLPFQLMCLLVKRKPSAKFGMWDLLGFAKFVYGEKIS